MPSTAWSRRRRRTPVRSPSFVAGPGVAALLAASIAAAIAVAACSHGASPQADAGAPQTSGSTVPAAPGDAGADTADASRCIDDGHADVRNPDGSRSQVACGDDAVCLGGACAPLRMPETLGGGSVERSRLLRFTGPGWIGAWTLLGPFDR